MGFQGDMSKVRTFATKSGTIVASAPGQPGYLDEVVNVVSQWSFRGPPGLRLYKNTRSDKVDELEFTQLPLGDPNVADGPFSYVTGGTPPGRRLAYRYFFKTVRDSGKEATIVAILPIKNIGKMGEVRKMFDSFKLA